MTTTIRRGTLVSFDPTTYKALVMLDGSLSEVEMAVGEWVPGALLAADDQVAVLLFADTNQEDGVILGPFGAASALLHITGTPTNGQVPIGSTASGALVLATLTGTADQITITNGAGSITISMPTNVNIAGYHQTAEIAAPSTPASGFLRWFADSTQSWAYFLNDAGAAVPAGVARLPLPLGAAMAITATNVAVQTVHQTLSFADGSTQTAYWEFKLPIGWPGRIMNVRLLWAPSTTNTGDCLWVVDIFRQATGVTLTAVAADTISQVQAGNGVADRAQLLTSWAGNLDLSAFAADEAMSIRLERRGSNVLDTFTGASRLLAIELSVVG